MSAYLRGALVEFTSTFLLPIPNVTIFQYNPETLTHAWTQPKPAGQQEGGGGQSDPLAVRGSPGESFNFTIAMDATDEIADGNPVSGGLAKVSGIYSRLAALEMLIFPSGNGGGGLLATVSAAVGNAAGLSPGGSAGGAANRQVPVARMPIVLFVWGPGRILPVRVTSLSITEKLYDAALNPTHAEATIGLQVLTPEDLEASTDTIAKVARAAYDYTQALREGLAVANLANAAESIIGMLPL
jgi:hypothetical protein